jgi:ADP-ribose pyrophosphatase
MYNRTMHIKRPSSKQPIPSHAKKEFTGKMFDVYQWEQELYDGKTATFEKIKREDTVGVIPITTDGKIIIARQEQPGTIPFVGTVGGRVDKGEEPLHAAERELMEETGFEAKEMILWYAIHPFDKIDWAIYLFIAKGCKKVKEQKLDAGEKIDLEFVTFEEFVKITAQHNYRDTEISLRMFRLLHDPEEMEKT